MKEKAGILAAIPAKTRFIVCILLDIAYLVVTFFTITIATFGVGAGLVIWTMTSFFELVAEEPSLKLYSKLNILGIIFAIAGVVLWVLRG